MSARLGRLGGEGGGGERIVWRGDGKLHAWRADVHGDLYAICSLTRYIESPGSDDACDLCLMIIYKESIDE